MPLSPGTRLGVYEVRSPLGAGGMGEVYLARDTKLDRDVAVKVLPDTMTRDPERVARFEREAKMLAALNHPNIAAIYGFDDADGSWFLVMEYVEGETLAQRVTQGPLPLDESISVTKQVAEALEAAHERGVIHRDLKPGNVMLRPDGVVKVLDFGLAKAMVDEPSGTDLANSPTITAEYTRPGMVLGTAAYMSPEQARGRAVDTRTDLWSLGVVIYECVTGERPFVGENATDTIGAILHKDIELDHLPASVPRSIQQLVRRCLQRDTRSRLQAAGDARIELEELAGQLKSGQIDAASELPTAKTSRAWPLVAAALAIALAFSLLRTPRSDSDASHAQQNRESVVTGLVRLTELPGMQQSPSLSPNGKMLLYVARDGLDSDIFLQRVGGENAINLTRDCDANDYDPVFSPDGERIAFRSQREGGGLFIMGATGESPRRVSEDGFDPAWSPDGQSLIYTTEDVEGPYSRATVAQLWIIDLQSQETRLLTKGDAVAPVYSPSGERVVYWASTGGVRDIFTIAVGGGDPMPVTQDTHTDWNPFFSPDGHTLYFISDRSGTPDLWQVAINEQTGEVSGAIRPVTAGAGVIDQASITADGSHIAFTAPMIMNEIQRYGFDAKSERVTSEPRTIFASTSRLYQFDVTRDGLRLAYRTGAPREDLVVMNADGKGRRRLMDDVHRDRGPIWTPDGTHLYFYSNRGGRYNAWIIRADGTGARPVTDTDGPDMLEATVSPDGRRVVVTSTLAAEERSLYFELDRPLSELTQLPSTPDGSLAGFRAARFSPDGKHLAGYGSGGRDNGTLGVLSWETMEVTLIRAPDGRGRSLPGQAKLDWIDNDRLILWDATQNRAFIYDVADGSTREVTGIQGPCDIRVVEDATALIVNRTREEADIWMLTLGSISSGPAANLSSIGPQE